MSGGAADVAVDVGQRCCPGGWADGHAYWCARPFDANELTSWVARGGQVFSTVSGRDVTEPLRISEHNGTTLRHALAGHGLAVSGTKRQQAVRLANAGVAAAHVEAWHTWRGRDSGPCSQATAQNAATDV